jgi:2-polyprenyl-3-methyl-5-hydroxy-6-metoxy-1,4-benzoquinol methylase
MAVRIDPEKNEPAALNHIGAHFEDCRVLEVGCGDGRLTETFADRARSVVAIDPEPGARAEFLRTVSHPLAEFRSVGFEAFEPAGRRFDVVLFSWSL